MDSLKWLFLFFVSSLLLTSCQLPQAQAEIDRLNILVAENEQRHKKEVNDLRQDLRNEARLSKQRAERVRQALDALSKVSEKLYTLNANKSNLERAIDHWGDSGFLSSGSDSGIESIIEKEFSILDQGIDSTKKELRDLKNLLQKNQVRISGLDSTISHYEKLIEEKDTELQDLRVRNNELKQEKDALGVVVSVRNQELRECKGELIRGELDISRLERRIEVLERLNKDLHQDMTRKYVFTANKEQLIRYGIVREEGRGKKKKVFLSEDFHNSRRFSEIENKEKRISVGKSNYQTLTYHPEGSYERRGYGRGAYILIVDPTEFWAVSNYLVVLYD